MKARAETAFSLSRTRTPHPCRQVDEVDMPAWASHAESPPKCITEQKHQLTPSNAFGRHGGCLCARSCHAICSQDPKIQSRTPLHVRVPRRYPLKHGMARARAYTCLCARRSRRCTTRYHIRRDVRTRIHARSRQHARPPHPPERGGLGCHALRRRWHLRPMRPEKHECASHTVRALASAMCNLTNSACAPRSGREFRNKLLRAWRHPHMRPYATLRTHRHCRDDNPWPRSMRSLRCALCPCRHTMWSEASGQPATARNKQPTPPATRPAPRRERTTMRAMGAHATAEPGHGGKEDEEAAGMTEKRMSGLGTNTRRPTSSSSPRQCPRMRASCPAKHAATEPATRGYTRRHRSPTERELAAQCHRRSATRCCEEVALGRSNPRMESGVEPRRPRARPTPWRRPLMEDLSPGLSRVATACNPSDGASGKRLAEVPPASSLIRAAKRSPQSFPTSRPAFFGPLLRHVRKVMLRQVHISFRTWVEPNLNLLEQCPNLVDIAPTLIKPNPSLNRDQMWFESDQNNSPRTPAEKMEPTSTHTHTHKLRSCVQGRAEEGALPRRPCPAAPVPRILEETLLNTKHMHTLRPVGSTSVLCPLQRKRRV